MRYMISFIPSILRLKGIIRRESIDIVHQNDIMQIQAPIAAKLTKTRVLWHLQGIPLHGVAQLFIPLAYFLADRIIVASGAIGDEYFSPKRRVFRRDFDIVYAPVDTEQFSPAVDSSSFKEEFHLQNARPVIGMIGNLNPLKGHRYFIQSAKFIKERHKGAKFLIVGKKLENRRGYIRELEHLAQELDLTEDVVFTGTRRDIAQVLSSLDVFVLPSLSEACPMVLLEAMAMGIPCVATGVGGVPEIVTHHETGLLVPPREPLAMAHAVTFFLNNRGKAETMGKRGRERVLSRFSLDICAHDHWKIYGALIQETRGFTHCAQHTKPGRSFGGEPHERHQHL
jgi:glycosyltransferase involved in cell wall biosynthesis